jgi:hypothetical protein
MLTKVAIDNFCHRSHIVGKVVDGRTFHPNCASKYWQKQAEEQRAKNRVQPKGLLEGISQQPNLHHVETTDKSQPQVESVPVRKNVS